LPKRQKGNSNADYQDICRQTSTFKGVVAIPRHGAFLMTNDVTELVKNDYVSGNYLSVLGVFPVLGHTFESEGSRKDPTAVISYGLWQRRCSARGFACRVYSGLVGEEGRSHRGAAV
jgi:hypothetical protein